jgi:16S rRNA G527 N7-methylase RsmG
MPNSLTRTLEWIGIDASEELLAQLARYHHWLTTEAVAAGGIGPAEMDRIETRHLADSLLFAGVWAERVDGPVLDVGSGVGLPGIPLALAVPSRHFVLIDRSGRRVRLLRRAVRILNLKNVEVIEHDIAGYDWSGHTTISRASLSPAALLELTREKGRPPELLVGGSHREPPKVPGFETVEIPPEILAHPVWILRMAQ